MPWWVLPVLLLAIPGILVWLILARVGQLKLKEWHVTWQQFHNPTPEFFRNLLRFTLRSGRLGRQELAALLDVEPEVISNWAVGRGFTPTLQTRRHVVKVLRRAWAQGRRRR